MSSKSNESKKKTLFLNQLAELTGQSDTTILNKAYEETRGNITKAVQFLQNYEVNKSSELDMPDLTGRSFSRQRAPGITVARQTPMEVSGRQVNFAHKNTLIDSGTSPADPVIDLTDSVVKEEADLRRAIELSMECASGNSSEDTKADQATSVVVTDIPVTGNTKALSNPHLRRRKSPIWPAGLKNVGNTCWFSAVIQSLFNLPVFRNHILHYKTPTEMPPENSKRYRNIQIMKELKYLFALMVGSNQSFVDPTKCVAQLQQAFAQKSSVECQQQDVSEFTHKLLDWLEDALKHEDDASTEKEENESAAMDVDGEEASASAQPRNPMVNLFYGTMKAHGINNGNSFTKPEKFGLFPLCVDGVDDLHESLELTTRDRMQGEVGQEIWFTSLPPVLIFELSRFQFSKKYGNTVKIHSTLDFPYVLYMDRYMEHNHERTRQCRDESFKLDASLRELKAQVRARRKITVGERSYPVSDILQCCTKFAAQRRKRFMEVEESTTPKDGASPSKKLCSSDAMMDSDLIDGQGDRATTAGSSDSLEKMIADTTIVEGCLKEWLAELEEEKESLRDDIADIQKRIDTMYDDPTLKEHPYILHAVLVHQGHAVAGHYWAYVRDHERSKWLKFNDTEVTESDWGELRGDSVGDGVGNTSAYCLMYIDRTREELLMGTPNGDKVLSSDQELQDMIETHNSVFANEVEDWDIQQAKLLSMTGAPESEKPVPVRPPTPARKISHDSSEAKEKTPNAKRERKDSLTSWHKSACKKAIENAKDLYDSLDTDGITEYDNSNIVAQASMLAIARAANTFDLKGPSAALLEVVKEEWRRLKELADETTEDLSDPRLQHIAVYMFKNRAPRKIVERAVLEQFADERMSYDPQAAEIMKCAKEKLKKLSPEDRNDQEFEKWQKDYRFFCKAMCYLIQGLELCQTNKHAEALPYLANVKSQNDRLREGADGEEVEQLLADWNLATRTIAVCVQNLHDQAIEKFRTKDEKSAAEGLSMLVESIVPWIYLLPVEGAQDGEAALIETIRNDWCTFCNDENNADLQGKLESALHALLDPPTQPETQAAFHTPALIRPQNPQDLCERFQNAMSTMLTAKVECT